MASYRSTKIPKNLMETRCHGNQNWTKHGDEDSKGRKPYHPSNHFYRELLEKGMMISTFKESKVE